ncbi:MAG: flagellar assembly protein FliH [Pseudomonadota bacterium]
MSVITAQNADLAERWNAPVFEGLSSAANRQWRTVGELQAVERSAWEEAEAEGRATGLAAAQQEIATRLSQLDATARGLDATLTAIARPLAQSQVQLHEQIAELAIAIARQLIRRELKTDPSQVIAVVRETVALLPAAARNVRVLMHPEDAALLRERLETPQGESAWSIQEDPMMSRGDCRVTAEAAHIDARIESRLAAAITAILGEERRFTRDEQQESPP